jgi:hypothetical protein
VKERVIDEGMAEAEMERVGEKWMPEGVSD